MPVNENINDIEDAMVRIGDLVAREVGVQKLARHTGEVREHPPCPDCGQPGERLGRDARDLITRRGKGSSGRGEVSLPEMSAAFFSLRRTDWELRPATTTRRMYRRIVFAARRESALARRRSRSPNWENSRCFPSVSGGPPNGSVRSRVAEARQAAVEYGQLPLPAQRQSPVEQVPQVVSVQMDGGRFQLRERLAAELDTSETESNDDGFWARVQGGRAAEHEERSLRGRSLSGPSRDVRRSGENAGNCPEQIKGFTSDSQVSIKADEAAGPDFKRAALAARKHWSKA